MQETEFFELPLSSSGGLLLSSSDPVRQLVEARTENCKNLIAFSHSFFLL